MVSLLIIWIIWTTNFGSEMMKVANPYAKYSCQHKHWHLLKNRLFPISFPPHSKHTAIECETVTSEWVKSRTGKWIRPFKDFFRQATLLPGTSSSAALQASAFLTLRLVSLCGLVAVYSFCKPHTNITSLPTNSVYWLDWLISFPVVKFYPFH